MQLRRVNPTPFVNPGDHFDVFVKNKIKREVSGSLIGIYCLLNALLVYCLSLVWLVFPYMCKLKTFVIISSMTNFSTHVRLSNDQLYTSIEDTLDSSRCNPSESGEPIVSETVYNLFPRRFIMMVFLSSSH